MLLLQQASLQKDTGQQRQRLLGTRSGFRVLGLVSVGRCSCGQRPLVKRQSGCLLQGLWLFRWLHVGLVLRNMCMQHTQAHATDANKAIWID